MMELASVDPRCPRCGGFPLGWMQRNRRRMGVAWLHGICTCCCVCNTDRTTMLVTYTVPATCHASFMLTGTFNRTVHRVSGTLPVGIFCQFRSDQFVYDTSGSLGRVVLTYRGPLGGWPICHWFVDFPFSGYARKLEHKGPPEGIYTTIQDPGCIQDVEVS